MRPSSRTPTWCSRSAAASASWSEYLAPRVAHLHVVEVDRRLEDPLRDALDPFANVDLHLADALELDFGSLDPCPARSWRICPTGSPPRSCSSRSPSCPRPRSGSRWSSARWRTGWRADRWAQLRRDLGARPALLRRALPAQGAAHGLPPGPERRLGACRAAATAPAPPTGLVALVHAGFAHRRKALAGSLALAPSAPGDIRVATRGALERMGRPADARAERLHRRTGRGSRPSWEASGSPPCGRAASSLPAVSIHEHAFAKLNLVLHVGGPRGGRGSHPLCSLFASIDLADEAHGGPAGPERTAWSARASRGRTSRSAAIEAFREHTDGLPAGASPCGSSSASPSRRGSRRQRRRRGGAADRQPHERLSARPGRPARFGCPRGRGRPQSDRAGPRARSGRGRARGAGRAPAAGSRPRAERGGPPQRRGLRELDRLGGGRERLDPSRCAI